MSVIRMMHLCSDCLSEWAGLSDEDLFLANWWNSHLRPKSLIASQLIRVRVLWSNSDHLQWRPQSFVQAGDEALGELHLHPGTDTQNSNCFKIIFSNFLVCGEDFWASQLDCVHWETLRLLLLCWQAGEWASGEGEHKSVERHIAQCHQDFDQFLKLNTKSPVTDASTCAHWSRNKLSWQNCTVLVICYRFAGAMLSASCIYLSSAWCDIVTFLVSFSLRLTVHRDVICLQSRSPDAMQSNLLTCNSEQFVKRIIFVRRSQSGKTATNLELWFTSLDTWWASGMSTRGLTGETECKAKGKRSFMEKLKTRK